VVDSSWSLFKMKVLPKQFTGRDKGNHRLGHSEQSGIVPSATEIRNSGKQSTIKFPAVGCPVSRCQMTWEGKYVNQYTNRVRGSVVVVVVVFFWFPFGIGTFMK
jgi:hypothetical protein